MISKLSAWGASREDAIRKMKRALEEYRITGVPTTIPFGLFVMDNEAFRRGDFDTGFVQNEFDSETIRATETSLEKIAALAAAWRDHQSHTSVAATSSPVENHSQNCHLDHWKLSGRRRALR